MELKESSSKSSRPPQGKALNNDHLITLKHMLDLPDGTGFESEYVPVGLDAMVRLCESRLELFNSRPDFHERRLREKCTVEFVL